MILRKRLKALCFLMVTAFTATVSSGSYGVVLNMHVGEEIRHLDPQMSTAASSFFISINLFSGLYNYDPKTAEPVNEMAVSHTRNEDASEYIFKLRKDFFWVKQENGKVVKKRPVTAHDYVFSYRRILAPSTRSEYAYMLYLLKNTGAIYSQ